MRDLGYRLPLYVLPFDHRHSYLTGMFGFTPPLTADQRDAVVLSKQLIYEGFEQALGGDLQGRPSGRRGVRRRDLAERKRFEGGVPGPFTRSRSGDGRRSGVVRSRGARLSAQPPLGGSHAKEPLMIAIDTNILARFYVDDPKDPEASKQRPIACSPNRLRCSFL
jgi:hypothetical protein